MIQIGGKLYYIDLKAFSDFVTENKDDVNKTHPNVDEVSHYDTAGELISRTVTKNSYIRGRDVNPILYETINNLLVTILEQSEPADELLGLEKVLSEQTIGFKLAFNTLLFNKILKDI